MCHMHRHWVTMAISALPYVGNALRPLATSIVNQIETETSNRKYKQCENVYVYVIDAVDGRFWFSSKCTILQLFFRVQLFFWVLIMKCRLFKE